MKKKVVLVVVLAVVLVLLATIAIVLGVLKTSSCTHIYGGWTKVDENTHKGTCSLCQEEQTVQHTWNEGTVTKTATCKEAGQIILKKIKYYTHIFSE